MVDQVRLFKIKSRWVGSVYKKNQALCVTLSSRGKGSYPQMLLGPSPISAPETKEMFDV